eukprot:762836-Hanusia_phi.AAC.6
MKPFLVVCNCPGYRFRSKCWHSKEHSAKNEEWKNVEWRKLEWMFDLRYFRKQKRLEELQALLLHLEQEAQGRPKNRHSRRKEIEEEIDRLLFEMMQ